MTRRLLTALMMTLLGLPPGLLLLTSFARTWTWPQLFPTQWQLLQWTELLRDADGLGAAGVTSAAIALCVAAIATGLGFPSSARLARHHGADKLLVLIHLPYAVSPVVLGVSLLYLAIKLDLAGTFLGVVLAQFIFAYAYAVILMSRFWTARITALTDLARTLGADSLQVFRWTTLPLALPLLTVCFFQTFLISWFDYALALLIGDGQVETLTIRLFAYLRSGDMGLASTCALILIAPPLTILLLDSRLGAIPSRRRASDTALRG